MGVCVSKAKECTVVTPEVKMDMARPKMNLMGSILDMKKVKKAPVLSMEQSPLYKKRFGPGSPTTPDTDSHLTFHRSAFFDSESPQSS